MREEDPQEQLIEAFTIVMDGRQNQETIESDDFKEFLMTMGYRWNEDLADEFMKAFESKTEKKVTPNETIKKLMKR
jgi:calmodulin